MISRGCVDVWMVFFGVRVQIMFGYSMAVFSPHSPSVEGSFAGAILLYSSSRIQTRCSCMILTVSCKRRASVVSVFLDRAMMCQSWKRVVQSTKVFFSRFPSCLEVIRHICLTFLCPWIFISLALPRPRLQLGFHVLGLHVRDVRRVDHVRLLVFLNIIPSPFVSILQFLFQKNV